MFEPHVRALAVSALMGSLAAAPAVYAQQETIREVTVQNVVWRVDGCYFSQSQEITCKVSIVNSGADRTVGLYQAFIIDSSGTQVNTHSWGFGQNEAHQSTLINGLTIPLTLRFRGVSPSVRSVARLHINPGGEPIVWNDVGLGKGPPAATAAGAQPGGKKSLTDRLKEKAGLGTSPASAPAAAPAQQPAAAPVPAAAPAPAAAASAAPPPAQSKTEEAKNKLKGLFGKKDDKKAAAAPAPAPAGSAATSAPK